jgi:hypothetical protein
VVGGARFAEEMHRRARLTSGRTIVYASGVNVQTWRGAPEVAHSGSTAGYRAYLARYPRQGVGVAVLCNHAGANATALARGVAESYLGAALSPRAAPAATASAAAAALPPARVAALVGRYRDPRTGETVTIAAEGGRARIVGGPALVPIDARRLVANGDTLVVGDAPGPILVVDVQGDSLRFEPLAPFAPTAAQLAAYAGTYVSDEADATIVVDVADGALRARRADGRSLGRLVPAYADAFEGGADVRFVRDAGGRVTALSVREPRVWDLRFVRR